MVDKLSSAVCTLGEKQGKCIEIVNTYNPYSKYIMAGVSIIVVLAVGILVIYLVKRKSKNLKELLIVKRRLLFCKIG